MSRVPRRLAAIALAIVGVLAMAACATGHDAVDRSTYQFVSPGGKNTIHYKPADRQQAPNLHGESLLHQGKQIHITDFPGKVMVVNIWGSWCGPCRSEVPGLEKLYKKYKSKGVQVLGIDVKETGRDAPSDFMRNNDVTYPSIYSPGGRALLALHDYPRSTIPSTIVLDKQHRVAAVYLRGVLPSDLKPELNKLLG